MLVGEYLDRWLPSIRGTVKERTWIRHEGMVRLHLKPFVGGIGLLKLNALNVQDLYTDRLESGFNPRSVQIVHATRHKALKQAVAWSLVPKNVTEAVTPRSPRRRRSGS